MLGTISSKVTAAPGLSGWSQVHEFVPEDSQKLSLRGRLFIVLSTKKSEADIDTLTSGRQFISRVHEEYYGNLSGKPFDVLKNAVEKVVSEFQTVWGNVEVSACALVGDVVYSAASGGGQVIISRSGAIAPILSSQDVTVSASGYPKHGDIIILATKAFLAKVSQKTISDAVYGGNPEEAAEIFAPLINSEDGGGTLGAAIIKFEGRDNITSIPETAVTSTPSQKIYSKFKIPDSLQIKKVFSKLIERIPRRSVYIRPSMGDEVSSQSKKLTLSVGIVLLFILVVSVVFGIRQKRINDVKNKYQGILAIANNDVEQAISLASVSPEKSREYFIDSVAKLKEIEALKVNDSKVDELKKRIEESRGAILGEYSASPELFLDLGLLSSGFKGDSILVSGGNIYILDKAGRRVVSVNESTKKSKVVSGPGVIDDVSGIAAYQDTAYILSQDGIYQIGSTKTRVIEKTWAGDALINSFAGNLYVLDKSGNQIYRYSGGTAGTFGSQQNWLAGGTSVNFSNALGWGMDGSVYVLYPNSKILKYSLGSPQNFSVSGVLPEIGNIDTFYADPDNQYIYLLDKAGKRVVVVDKKGKYKAQYTDDQIGSANGLVVSEAQKQIILLSGDKLLSIVVKHL